MKVYLRVKNEKEIVGKIEKANELLRELGRIFSSYDGLSRGLEVEIMPAQEDAQAQKFTDDSNTE